MSDIRVSGNKPPETVLPAEPSILTSLIDEEVSRGVSRATVAELAARFPTSPTVWALYASVARDDLESYLAYRVGYHRGLDALRQNGWKGSGYVRWAEPTNRGFLRCLLGLSRSCRAIGELGEAERCRQFLGQLDPTTSWDEID